MDMVFHHLHGINLHIICFSNLVKEVLHGLGDLSNEQSLAVFWRPDNVILQVINSMGACFVGHTEIVAALRAARFPPHSKLWGTQRVFSRINLSIRQHVAAVGRRVTTLCKGEDGMRQQLALYHVYYNFCLPHASLRQPLPEPIPTNGTGSAKQWRPCTPAMAAGLTDHRWTLAELLHYQIPLPAWVPRKRRGRPPKRAQPAASHAILAPAA